MTQLSPPKYIAFNIGVEFTAKFFGHLFAGKIAQLSSVQDGGTNVFSEEFSGKLITIITKLNQSEVSSMGEIQ